MESQKEKTGGKKRALTKRDHYRGLYEAELGCKIPKGWDIHHIDEDRDNNTITNLVAIPATLHRSYHTLKNELSVEISRITDKDLYPRNASGRMHLGYVADMMLEYKFIYYSIVELMDYRDCKRGVLTRGFDQKYY